MKKRYTEEQIIGFLREADAGRSLSADEDAARPLLSLCTARLWRCGGLSLCRHLLAVGGG